MGSYISIEWAYVYNTISVQLDLWRMCIRLACWPGRGPKRGRDLRVFLWLQPLHARLTHVEIRLGDCEVGFNEGRR